MQGLLWNGKVVGSKGQSLRLDIAQLHQRVHDPDAIAPELFRLRVDGRVGFELRKTVIDPLDLRLERLDRQRGGRALDGWTLGQRRENRLELKRLALQLGDLELRVRGDLPRPDWRTASGFWRAPSCRRRPASTASDATDAAAAARPMRRRRLGAWARSTMRRSTSTQPSRPLATTSGSVRRR
jgi:hypothetical protein